MPTAPMHWIAELEAYVAQAARMRRRQRRIRWAQLDGEWQRLRRDHGPELAAAIERVNAALPPERRVGFYDTLTREWVGHPRDVSGLGPSAV